ncbi:MAG: hypothetical protein DRP01_03880 [Archaeoglobales archaeon]|nr:MAG: hypothetical protein DRP01_03880 [Archaeoglobales archaeon]
MLSLIRNPFRRYPFYGSVDPDWVVKTLNGLGLRTKVTDLTWIRKEMRKSLPLRYMLTWTEKRT